jgi:hypothetical protein
MLPAPAPLKVPREAGAKVLTRRVDAESGDLMSARNHVSEQAALMEKRGHDRSAANQEVSDNSEGRRQGDACSADRSATSPKENKNATSN